MSDIKNKNFSFRAVVFSSKLFSVIAATMLLLLVDGAIDDAPAVIKLTLVQQSQGQQSDEQKIKNLEARLERLETANDVPNNHGYYTHHFKLVKLGQRINQLERLVGIRKPLKTKTVLVDLLDRMDAVEQAFAEKQTSVTQDITSTGHSTTQVSVPMAACSFLVNNQNVCTETNVTTVTAIVSVAVLGGIIAGVLTAVNNEANSNEQREKDRNLYLTLIAIQNGQQKSSGAQVCYDNNGNVIPCP